MASWGSAMVVSPGEVGGEFVVVEGDDGDVLRDGQSALGERLVCPEGEAVQGLCRMKLSGVMPNGNIGTMMSQRLYCIYCINQARAPLDGLDLGPPTRLPANPMTGGIALPVRGVMAVGRVQDVGRRLEAGAGLSKVSRR